MKSSVVGQHQMNTKRAVTMGDFNYKAPQIFFIDDDDKQQLLRTSVESHYILPCQWRRRRWWRTGQDQHDMVTTGLRSTALIISYCLLLFPRTIARSLGTKYPNASLGGQQWTTLVRICTGAFVCTGTCPGGESAQSWACLSSSVHHQHPLSSSSSWYYYSDWPLATTPLGTTILWLALCVALFGCQGVYCVLCEAGRQGGLAKFWHNFF